MRSQRYLLGLATLLAAGCSETRSPARAPSRPTAPTVDADGRGPHGLPTAVCPKCNPALVAVFKAKGDWCEEHGLPESFCPKCNPDAQAPVVEAGPAASDWCGGHGLPESKCTKCNPGLIAAFQAKGDWCAEHSFPESACPVCNPQVAPGAAEASVETRIVRLDRPDIERVTGIEVQAAGPVRGAASIECTARIAFDADRVADVRALVPGIVRKVHAELGAEVTRGAPLFTLESTRVSEIQGALETAKERVKAAEANLARQRGLRESDIASARQVEIAERELASARAAARSSQATLRMAGAAASAPSGRYTITTPIAGTVVRRPAVLGWLATQTESLATVADTTVMWALCDVPEREAARVERGQRVKVWVQGRQGAVLEGALTWIAAEVDPRTRTVTARAEVPNPDGRLRANQFARARIETGALKGAVSVPRSAVQRVGDQEVVFVRTAPGVYAPRLVKRYGDGANVQVEGRVSQGDEVVTTGAVLLRTEVMPNSIGAGCCEPGGE